MMTNQTREDYYAQIKEIYAQKYESKLHKWQKTREDYYAQIKEMYVQMYESKDKEIEAEDRRFREYLMLRNDDDDETWTETDWWYRSEKENPEDQALDDEELVETEVATELIGIEDETVKREANAEVISAIVKEEQIPQIQVPIANSEILKSIELGKVDLGLENEEYVVLNENLEQEWVQKKVKTSFEADGDVGKGQKMVSNTKICSAHQLLDQMPSNEKRSKHIKAWKFKFKPTSKRSRLMGDKSSFVDATVLLNKDSLETIWDCVKKEFEETMAACEKNVVDRFKLAEEIGSSATKNVQVTEWIHEEESEKERKWKDVKLSGLLQSYYDDQGKSAELVMRDQTQEIRSYVVYSPWVSVKRDGAVETQTCISRRANHVWKPGGFVHPEIQLDWLERADSNQEKESNKKLRNVDDGVKQDKNRFSGDVGAKISMALEELHLLQVMRNTKLKFAKQWMFKFRTDSKSAGTNRILLQEKKPSDDRFQIKHKWRFRLSHSFSEMKQRMTGRVWKSFGYLMEDIREKRSVSADREGESNQATLRFSTWVIETLLNHYIVLLLTPVAYAIQFLGGVGMDKKQSHLSLWINRVWDPGRSLVKDASYSTRIFSSLPATVPVSLLCQESFAYQITSFYTNLEVKVSLKGEDLIQDKSGKERHVWHVRRKQARGHVDG